jgi:hypothetical protein
MSGDTTAEALRVQRAVFARMSGSERVEAAMEMAETAKEVAMAGIRSRNPSFNDRQVFRAWFVTLHGEDLAAQLLDADSKT